MSRWSAAAGGMLMAACAAGEAPRAFHLDAAATWKSDLMVARPGADSGPWQHIGQLDLRAGLTTPGLGGHPAAFELSGYFNDGGELSSRLGDLQGVSNIEAGEAGWRLSEAWLDHALGVGDATLRIGVQDLNSEFDVLQPALLFVNSAFGVGTDLGQSGVNGPVTFPSTGLGVRFALTPAPGTQLRLAAFDAVPGDPLEPGRVDLDWNEGTLLVAEAGHKPDAGTRLVAGLWRYSRTPPPLCQGLAGCPDNNQPNAGGYLRGAATLRDTGTLRLASFARLGYAANVYHPFDVFFSGGITMHRPGEPGTPARVGLGFAVARTTDAQRLIMRSRAGRSRPYEAVVELTFRRPMGTRGALQPWLQYVRYPAGAPSLDDSLVVGLRLELWIEGRR